MLAVAVRVMAAGFRVMLFSVAGVAMGAMRVMRGLLMIARFVMPRSFAVMLCGMLVMLGRFVVVMLNGLVIAHGRLPV